MFIRGHVIVFYSAWMALNNINPRVRGHYSLLTLYWIIPKYSKADYFKCLEKMVKHSTFNTQTMTNTSDRVIDAAFHSAYETELIYLENK